eukprot:m.1004305 g.1004305  ORF g.1004305 m.1004305 type:complete len:367 (-) comp24048_c0_seq17:577-1677(-)
MLSVGGLQHVVANIFDELLHRLQQLVLLCRPLACELLFLAHFGHLQPRVLLDGVEHSQPDFRPGFNVHILRHDDANPLGKLVAAQLVQRALDATTQRQLLSQDDLDADVRQLLDGVVFDALVRVRQDRNQQVHQDDRDQNECDHQNHFARRRRCRIHAFEYADVIVSVEQERVEHGEEALQRAIDTIVLEALGGAEDGKRVGHADDADEEDDEEPRDLLQDLDDHHDQRPCVPIRQHVEHSADPKERRGERQRLPGPVLLREVQHRKRRRRRNPRNVEQVPEVVEVGQQVEAVVERHGRHLEHLVDRVHSRHGGKHNHRRVQRRGAAGDLGVVRERVPARVDRQRQHQGELHEEEHGGAPEPVPVV